MTSTIAFLVGIPISLIFQFELNPLSIFYNFFFIPFVSFLIFPFCFLVLFFPFLDSIFCVLISILENMGRMGLMIPQKVSDMLVQLQGKEK